MTDKTKQLAAEKARLDEDAKLARREAAELRVQVEVFRDASARAEAELQLVRGGHVVTSVSKSLPAANEVSE